MSRLSAFSPRPQKFPKLAGHAEKSGEAPFTHSSIQYLCFVATKSGT
jgi:hypothetical protein